MQLAPDQVLLTANIQFRRPLDITQLEASIDRIKAALRKQDPALQQIFIEADHLPQNGDASLNKERDRGTEAA